MVKTIYNVNFVHKIFMKDDAYPPKLKLLIDSSFFVLIKLPPTITNKKI